MATEEKMLNAKHQSRNKSSRFTEVKLEKSSLTEHGVQCSPVTTTGTERAVLCEQQMTNESTRETLLQSYHTLTRRNAGLDPHSRRVMFKSFARILGSWLPESRNLSILDIGCGEGVLLAFLRDRGYTNLSGFDLSPENVEICRQRGLTFVQLNDALRLEDFPGAAEYEVIFCFDVLEHLAKEDALSFLRQVYARIAKGGHVVLQTPNMGSIAGLFHRYHDLTHEFGVTESSAVTLLMTAGFQEDCIEVRPSWNATTLLGYLRELYLRALHLVFWLAEGSTRPRIPTKNLLIRAFK